MATLNGSLTTKGTPPKTWNGFRVGVAYPMTVKLQESALEVSDAATGGHERTAAPVKARPPVSQKARQVIIPQEVSVEVDGTGNFTAELVDLALGKIVVTAFGLSGQRLASATVDAKAVTGAVMLTVDLPTLTALAKRDDPFDGQRPRLKGRVLCKDGSQWLAGHRIVIIGVEAAAAGAAAGVPLALASATVDASGYFAADYPCDAARRGVLAPRPLTSAYAIVEGARDPSGNPEIPISLVSLGKVATTLPMALALTVDRIAGDDGPTDCACDALTPRAPDAIDLTSSDAFSEDLGTSGCVKLTTPNRALEEFSFYTTVRTTDPEIIVQGEATVDISGVAISPKLKMISTVPASIIGRRRGRAPLSATNAINWDDKNVDSPAFFEATSVAHGHLLQFKQVWRADGYSLGDLLYSLPLAPGQKKQIAIVDWERRESTSRTEATSFDESLNSLLSRDRDISEIVSTTLREHAHGESDALTIGSAHGSGVAGSGNQGGGSFGGLAATSMSGGYSQSSATQDSARELVASAVQRIHDQTMQASSAVRSLRSSVIQTVSQGERVSVTTEVVANHNHCHALTIQYFEVLRHFKVTTELADVRECLYIPLPLSPFTHEKIQRWRDLLSGYLRKPALLPAFDANDRALVSWANADMPPGRYADEEIHFLHGNLVLFVRAPRQNASPTDTVGAVVDAAGDYLPDAVEKMAHVFLDLIGGSSNGEPLANPRLYFRIKVRNGGQPLIPMQFTLLDEFAPNKRLRVRARMTTTAGGLPPRSSVDFVEVGWQPSDTDGLPEGCDVLISSATMHYRTAHFDHVLFDEPNTGAGLAGDAALFDTSILDREEMRNPIDEDKTLQRKLKQHLNQHLEYYHKAIWWSMDADRRFMLLDGYLAPTRPNEPQRSLAAVIDNRLLGFVGNSLVMPVGHGIRLDPSYDIDPHKPASLRDLYPSTLLPPARISLPTKGVFAEAVMGECNSCEAIDENRFWRWQDVPTGDEPVSIQPPSTEGRRSEPPSVLPAPFPTSVVTIQSPPTLPEPSGLTGALQLLSKSDLFKDLTGLELNQKNALEAMKSNLEAAKHFADEASKLAQQKQMKEGGIDKTMQSIQEAQKAGLLDSNKAQSLTSAALEKLIGSDSKKALTEDPGVKGALGSAVSKPASKVSVRRGDESVEVEASNGGSLTQAGYVHPEIVGDLTSTVSYPHFQALSAALKANPFNLDAALAVVEKSLLGWSDFRVDLKFSSPPRYPGPGVEGLRDSAVYLCGNILMFVAKGSTDTDGRTNNVGTNPNLETSYRVRAADGTLKSLDAFTDAYFVLSQTVLGLCGSRSKPIPGIPAGTLGHITSSRNNTSSFAIYGDAGPCHAAGEISVALAQALGYVIQNPAGDSAEDTPTPGLRYTVFLGTSKSRATADVTPQMLADEGGALIQDHLQQYAWHLLNRAIKEAPGGAASTDGTVMV